VALQPFPAKTLGIIQGRALARRRKSPYETDAHLPELHYDEANWKPSHNPWLVALTVTLATFMEVLDTSIANVALPHMAGSLGASQEEATWVLTSYLVSSAVILPISGWLMARMGRKRFYMTCVMLFTICSMLCGLAQSLPLLVFFRVLQGVGGGGLAPSEQAILADTFPVSKRGQAFAVYGMAVVVAPAIGPTLGGWITDNFNWHWIFFINLPVGLLSLFLTQRMVEDPPYLKEEQKVTGRVDFMGLGLISIGVGCLEFVLDKGQEKDWFGDPNITAFAIIAVCLLAVFVWWEWRHDDPIVDIRLLKNRNFGTAVFLQFVLGMVLFGTTVLIPQFFAGAAGVYSGACRDGAVTGGAGADVHDADCRPHCERRETRSAAVGGNWLRRHGGGVVQPDTAGFERDVWTNYAVARLPGDGAVVHFYSDQHAELSGGSAEQEQSDFEFFQFCAQYRGLGRHRSADDVPRKNAANPYFESQCACGGWERTVFALPGHDPVRAGTVGAKHGRRETVCDRKRMADTESTGADAELPERVLGIESDHRLSRSLAVYHAAPAAQTAGA
jgi:MFS family permease